MQTGAITGHIDVAQVTLYVFFVFFIALIWYLHRENKREGYPLIDERGRKVEGLPPVPRTKKTFLMHDGTKVMVPRDEPVEVPRGVATNVWPGAPLTPIGDPLLSAMGPGSYAHRADVPDLTYDDNLPKIVPLRAATAFFLATEDPDVRGYVVMGSDGVIAGTVVDAWIDRSEVVVRYLEVQLALTGATHNVLLPMNYLQIRRKQSVIRTGFIKGGQFASVPTTKLPDVVTLLEEDKIMAFYAGGMLYATPSRAEALL